MKIADEKVFIYKMMGDITEERRKLTDQYFSLKERLDTLHKLEEKGLGELSTKGFIDLFNDRETQQTIQNMNREVEYHIARREEKSLLPPRYDKIADSLERGAADRAKKMETDKAEMEKRDRIVAWEKKERELAEQEQEIIDNALKESEQVAMRLQEENDAKKSDAAVKDVIPKVLIEETKDKETKAVKTTSDSRYLSGLKTKEATYWVKQVLKDNGRPLKLKEVYEQITKLSGYEVTYKNFCGNIIQRVMKADPKIQRASTGFLQYNTRG